METYDDNDPSHQPLLVIPQRICFGNTVDTGTHQRSRWCSTTKNWKGWAHQEGDQVFMHGNYQMPDGNIGSTTLQWEIVTNANADALNAGTKGYGHCVDWYSTSTSFGHTNVFANVRFIREVENCNFDTDCVSEVDDGTACGNVDYTD